MSCVRAVYICIKNRAIAHPCRHIRLLRYSTRSFSTGWWRSRCSHSCGSKQDCEKKQENPISAIHKRQLPICSVPASIVTKNESAVGTQNANMNPSPPRRSHRKPLQLQTSTRFNELQLFLIGELVNRRLPIYISRTKDSRGKIRMIH